MTISTGSHTGTKRYLTWDMFEVLYIRCRPCAFVRDADSRDIDSVARDVTATVTARLG